MSVELLTDHHLEFLSLIGGSTSILVKMPHCWKSHVMAHFIKQLLTTGHDCSVPVRGVWWLSGRVLDSRSRGCRFKPHQQLCVVSLSKTLYPLLSTGSTQDDLSRHDFKIVDWDVKNQTKQKISACN